jgi:CheY-like chemotaxis protein
MRAFPCRTGAEAVCVAREVTPDLIVLNYELPDMGGAEVCRHLREDGATASIPVIVLTTDVEAVRTEICFADAVLTKPCPAETLSAAARLFIRHLTFPEDTA